MSTSIQPIQEVRQSLEQLKGQFRALLPSQEHVDRFVRVVATAAQNNPDLLAADRNSFYSACMKAATDGLLPDGRESVLVVYNSRDPADKNKWIKTVQYQPMVEGMMAKLRLSGEILGAPRVHVVKDGDFFEYELGDHPRIVHRPAVFGKRGKTIGAYSSVTLKDGEVSHEIMDMSEIESVRARSKSADSGPWKTDTDEMARKTVFRRHSKKLPKKTQLDKVLEHDNETFDLSDKSDVPDVPASTPTAPAAEKPSRPRVFDAIAQQVKPEEPAPVASSSISEEI